MRIPDRSEITDETPLLLEAAAYLSGWAEADLKRAIKQGAVQHEVIGNRAFLTLGYIAEMAPVVRVPKPSAGNCIVYVVGFGPYVKIGRTSGNLDKRLSAIGTSCPEPLKLYGALDAPPPYERELHRRFAPYRLQGEWFRRRGALSKWISAGCPMEEQGCLAGLA